jgi:hypothetical protein
MQKFPLALGLAGLFFLGRLYAEQLPEMRPALIGTSPASLINRIDTESLMKRGQTDAIVRFTCFVNYLGHAGGMVTYRGSANSNPLAEEAIDKSDRATFIPAVYRHETRNSLVSGTIIFGVINGKPHLRIYLNQEEEHLKHGDDFISPQPVFWEGDKFKGITYPERGSNTSGTVAVKLDIDVTGKLGNSKITFESPAGRGFGDEVMRKIGSMTFLPGYLHGKPVASSTTWQVLFRAWMRGTHWKTD